MSASTDGLGVASRLISLAASGTGVVDLSMSSASPPSGFVHAFTGGHDGGLSAVQISATNGTLVRSATTVTTGSEKGHFTLPELPLGKWWSATPPRVTRCRAGTSTSSPARRSRR